MTTRPPSHLRQGHDAEQQACEHLQRQGLRLVERNYRSRYGEIDLIMHHDHALVFVEVRYRKSIRFGSPAETVDARKQARIRATAEHYLLQHPQRAGISCRFDVVAVTPAGSVGTGTAADYTVDWLPDAFGI
jgi:putative endonuclease